MEPEFKGDIIEGLGNTFTLLGTRMVNSRNVFAEELNIINQMDDLQQGFTEQIQGSEIRLGQNFTQLVNEMETILAQQATEMETRLTQLSNAMEVRSFYWRKKSI